MFEKRHTLRGSKMLLNKFHEKKRTTSILRTLNSGKKDVINMLFRRKKSTQTYLHYNGIRILNMGGWV